MARLDSRRPPNYREWTIYRLYLQYKRSFTMPDMIDEVVKLVVASGRKPTKQTRTWIMKTLKDLILRRRLVYKKGSSHRLKLSPAFASAVRELRHGPGSSRITPQSLRSYKQLSKLRLYQAPKQNELFDINIQLQEECDSVVQDNHILTQRLKEVTEQRDVVMGERDDLRAELAASRGALLQGEPGGGHEEDSEMLNNDSGRITETPPPQQPPTEPQLRPQHCDPTQPPCPPVTPVRVVPLVSQYSGLPTPPETVRPPRRPLPTRLQSLSYEERQGSPVDRTATNVDSATNALADQAEAFNVTTTSTSGQPDVIFADIQRQMATYASQQAARDRVTRERMDELEKQLVDTRQTVAGYIQKETTWKIQENSYKENERKHKEAERALMLTLKALQSDLDDTHRKLASVEDELRVCRDALRRQRFENSDLRRRYDAFNRARVDLIRSLQRIDGQLEVVLGEQADPFNLRSNPHVKARIQEVEQAYRRGRSV